ncbi:4-hydroxy-3-methylbut-2-enyl diphosphate reductase [Leptospira ellisii]|uniref:4-hydroxy-3-methylbut-2-enyl diphosphate reductase n=1 Tax=Leptospira ellisii TaxID=2023197 RepID=A0AAE4QMB4_9LEPT|nr:4-hydroxy-3-methylbut-2-enyl diphosphate reductase [Leptospira ellisii]MDV6235603.1 4-hydroxy-3-methylbut-2-enyl diphosphate reductase [Leptospira ellisii]
MSRISKIIRFLGAFLVLAFLFPVTASTVILKNGKTLQGKIVNQSRTEVQIEVNGKVQIIPKSEISEINLKDPKKEDPKKVVTKQQETKTEEPSPAWKETKWTLTARSALLPGWGQWRMGQKKWAVISFALFAGSAFYTISSKQKADAEEANYKSNSVAITMAAFSDPTLNPVTSDSTVRDAALVARLIVTTTATNPYFESYNQAIQQYNQAQWLLGAIYGLQLIHTFLFARDFEKMQALMSDPNPEGLRFSASMVKSPTTGMTEITPTAVYTFKF